VLGCEPSNAGRGSEILLQSFVLPVAHLLCGILAISAESVAMEDCAVMSSCSIEGFAGGTANDITNSM
jgi:hypothetical protein